MLRFSRISAVMLKVSRKLAGFSALRVNPAKPDISRQPSENIEKIRQRVIVKRYQIERVAVVQ